MASQLETLFKLQEIDLDLLEKRRRIEEFEARVAERSKAMTLCKARIDELAARRKDLVTTRALAERRVNDSQEQLKERRQRMTRVRTERELRANESELGTLRGEISEQEEQLLAVMGQVEELERQIGVLQKEYEDLAQADHRDIDAEFARVEALKTELADARGNRDSVADVLDATLRGRYETVLKRRAGRAVVAVLNGSCGGCHMHVPHQTINEILKSGAVRLCPSCQRILFVPEPAQ